MSTEQRPRRGRPRGFDADEALERAMVTFWEHGYEGASLAALTEAMGISTTSMYGTFGNKEELFRRALDRYADGPAGYAARALEAPTALEVARTMLHGAVETSTRPATPNGCLTVQGALATGESGRGARDLLADWRRERHVLLRERLERALEEGDLPAGSDPDVLARFLIALGSGIAVQAAGGAGQEELRAMADAALRSWPLA